MDKEKIIEIIKRHERGYINTLYGNSFYTKLQKDTDFDELIKEVKNYIGLADISKSFNCGADEKELRCSEQCMGCVGLQELDER